MFNTKWTLSAVILAAAFAAAPQANAQSEHYRGTFKLDFEARFGNTILQPGNYSVSTLEGAKGIRIMGDKGSVALLAASYDVRPGTERAKLILVDSDGTYALQSFESGAMGKELHFLVKRPRGTVEHAAAVKPTIEVGLQ
jgi:hypothetical protein